MAFAFASDILPFLPLWIVAPAAVGAFMLFPGTLVLRVLPPVGLAVNWLLLVLLGSPVLSGQPAVVALGNWAAPLGITLRLDALALLFLALTTLVISAVTLYAQGEELPGRNARAFWSLLFFLWAGLNGVFLSYDLFNLYVVLEIASVGGVALVALGGGAAALVAQMRYLLFATFASIFYLFGVAILYGELGVLDLGLVADAVTSGPAAAAALILMTLGLLLKAAIWPLHFWLPPAHASAPTAVSAVLSALAVKGPLYLLLRLWFEVFPTLPPPAAWYLLGALGGTAVIWASFLALRQERLKLMIAYSTVAQLGYMLLVFALAMPGSAAAVQAWQGGMLQILSHGLAKSSMFLSAGAIMNAVGSDRIQDLAGATRRVPVPLFALALSGLSIMALPVSGGFLAKWLMLGSAIAIDLWWVVAVLLVGGLLSAGYVLRFLLRAFVGSEEDAPATVARTGVKGAAAMALAFLSLLLGIGADPVLRLITLALPPVLEAAG
ncbi:MAG TPA: proton-conducting transporter membrane subunit [Kiloniellales bacterium]|nr:proton-conducting transporter membrane subunit [Kiloniellales bacterium]